MFYPHGHVSYSKPIMLIRFAAAKFITFMESVPSELKSFSRCSASYLASASASRQAATVRMLSLLKPLNRQTERNQGRKPEMREGVASVKTTSGGGGGSEYHLLERRIVQSTREKTVQAGVVATAL